MLDLEVEKMDVKETFLHGYEDEEVYMKKLERFIVKGKKELLFKLKNPLSGLKKSPRTWYQNFDAYILGLRFVRSKFDHYVYSNRDGDHFFMWYCLLMIIY